MEPEAIDRADVVAEVTAAFWRYEAALNAGDGAVLDAAWWADPRAVRLGLGENLYGEDAIRAFRAATAHVDLRRDVGRLQVTTFGADAAVTVVEVGRGGTFDVRQMQTWVRVDGEWRIVAAHVSRLVPY